MRVDAPISDRDAGTPAALVDRTGLLKQRLQTGTLALPWVLIAVIVALYADEIVRVATSVPVPPAELALFVAFQVVPLLLVVVPLGIAIAALEQRVVLGAVSREVRYLVEWTPRVALFLFAAFISVFALDVFVEGRGFWETAAALFMHLIPTIGLLLAALLAWRWPSVGAVTLAAWSAWYVATFCCAFSWTVYLGLAGGPLALALLFVLDWLLEHPAARTAAA